MGVNLGLSPQGTIRQKTEQKNGETYILRNFTICSIHFIASYKVHQIKEDKIAWGMRNANKILVGSNRSEDITIFIRRKNKILKHILQKQDVRMNTGFLKCRVRYTGGSFNYTKLRVL